MAGAYSNYIHERKSPQYAYALVILSGGIAFMVFQTGEPYKALLIYALAAALFSFIWPYKALQWGGWLCLPILMLICFDVIITASPLALLRNGPVFAKALPSACFGAYLGSKLSFRRITSRASRSTGHGKQFDESRARAQKKPGRKELAAPPKSLSLLASTPNPNGSSSWKSAHAKSMDAELIKAAQGGDLERIEQLVAEGADVNAVCGDELTPLMIAACYGDAETVRALFGKGALLDASSDTGLTALMIATIEGHLEIARVLLEGGAKVNAQDDRGWTALRFAVSMNETEILRLLINSGADLNLADKEGATALMQAAGENLVESVKALLDAGADPFIRNQSGQTALDIARRRRSHTKIIGPLKQAEARAIGQNETAASVPIKDEAYFYLLKEELEEGLNSYPHSSSADEVMLCALSALKALQEHIDKTQREAAPSRPEISQKLMLTLKEAAALSGLPRRHLLEAVENGALKAQQVGYVWHIRRADLDDYISRLCV